MAVAEVYGFGRKKYARLNYLKGYDWSLSYDALQRHLNLFWAGYERDGEERVEELVNDGVPEHEAWEQVLTSTDEKGNLQYSGLHHLAHAGWHCLGLLSFVFRGIGNDDRPTAEFIRKQIEESES